MSEPSSESAIPKTPRIAFLGALTSDLLSPEGAQAYEPPAPSPLRAPFGTRYAARVGGLLTQPAGAKAETKEKTR